MKKQFEVWKLIPFYLLILGGFVIGTAFGSRAVTVMAESTPKPDRHCIIVDAGHGGEDGGTTSCSGVLESQINLEISLRLNDLLHLLGYDTVMIRTTDKSVYTNGETIAEKKVSDLKERVRIANATEKGILISIHQNHFTDSKYSGAQVFYNRNDTGQRLAEIMQTNLVQTVNRNSNRKSKKADGVYLMEHAQIPGVLVECGFLSNTAEDVKLRTPEYQKKLCCVIGATLSQFLNS